MSEGNLQRKLKERYGAKEGTQIYIRILPGLLGDFKKMLKNAEPGEVVREEYHFEDDDGVVVMTGSRDENGEMKIEADLI